MDQPFKRGINQLGFKLPNIGSKNLSQRYYHLADRNHASSAAFDELVIDIIYAFANFYEPFTHANLLPPSKTSAFATCQSG